MPCYHPIPAWQLLNVRTVNGKPTLSFKDPFAKPSSTRIAIEVPCGQCIGCRLERSREWAVRCYHEAQMHEDSAFITLTYADASLPKDGSLNLRHFQLFMKKFRKFISEYVWVPKLRRFKKMHKLMRFMAPKVKMFHCGEYGEINERPHYHACIFGFGFPDKVFHQRKNGFNLYRSEMLRKIWGHGHCLVGDVTFESAAYIARYVTKKVTGEHAEGWYAGRDPEYSTMSRRGGIGKSWYEKFSGDVFPADEVVVRGKVMKPPRYYDKRFELDNVGDFTTIKESRKKKALDNAADNTRERLAVKEQVKISQVTFLKRGLEAV